MTSKQLIEIYNEMNQNHQMDIAVLALTKQGHSLLDSLQIAVLYQIWKEACLNG